MPLQRSDLELRAGGGQLARIKCAFKPCPRFFRKWRRRRFCSDQCRKEEWRSRHLPYYAMLKREWQARQQARSYEWVEELKPAEAGNETLRNDGQNAPTVH